MIDRYLSSAIEEIWNPNQIAKLYWKIEVFQAEAWHQQGLISASDLAKIQQTQISFSRWKEIEQKNHHEIAAFVDMLSEQAGSAGRFIHYGLTSNDVLDTAHHYSLFSTNQFLLTVIADLLTVLKTRAQSEKNTLMIGRTHGMYAEPITLGYKFALWYAELKRHADRLTAVGEQINICKIAGPTGLRPNIPLAVNAYVAQKLGMQWTADSSQLIIRDRLVDLASAWIGLSLTIEKIATEIRNLQRDGINEVQEFFAPSQKGSSAMPHKKNPYLSENICGLMRVLRNDCQALWSTNLTWHERDLTNSAIERIKLIDASHLAATGLERLKTVIKNLKINHDQITRNLKSGIAATVSHQLLLSLTKNSSHSRDEAYRSIQKLLFGPTKTADQLWTAMQKNDIFASITKKEWTAIVNGDIYRTNINALFTAIFND